MNALSLSNYEYTLKKQTKDDEDGKKDEDNEDKDDRSKRVQNTVDQINFRCEDPSALESDDVKF